MTREHSPTQPDGPGEGLMRSFVLLLAVAMLSACTVEPATPLKEPIRLYAIQPQPTGDSTEFELSPGETVHIRALPDLVISDVTAVVVTTGYFHRQTGTNAGTTVTNRLLDLRLAGAAHRQLIDLTTRAGSHSLALFWGDDLLATNVEYSRFPGGYRTCIVLHSNRVGQAIERMARQPMRWSP